MMKSWETITEIPAEEELTVETEAAASTVAYLLPISKAASIAQGYLREIYASEEDDEESRQNLNELVERILNQATQSGDVDDFHNFAVALARKDEYALACSVLTCGLQLFPKNVDLLADFLKYGVNCGKSDECFECYLTLTKIPRLRWTWRGFVFLVDYLLYLTDQMESIEEIEKRKQEMLSITADFKKFYPDSEDAFRTEAEVFSKLGSKEEEQATLREALERLEVCPKCALRYADILFDKGKYDEALEQIRRGISDATQTQSSVSEGYIYYLSGLCLIAKAQKKRMPLTKKEVKEVYADFNIAVKEFGDHSSYIDVIRSKTNTLINLTGVEVTEEYASLYDCITEY